MWLEPNDSDKGDISGMVESFSGVGDTQKHGAASRVESSGSVFYALRKRREILVIERNTSRREAAKETEEQC